MSAQIESIEGLSAVDLIDSHLLASIAVSLKRIADVLASADTRPEGGDSTEIEAPFTGGAVVSKASETPKA